LRTQIRKKLEAAAADQNNREIFLPATWDGGYFHVPQLIRQLLKRNKISGMIQMQILLEIAGEQARHSVDGTPAPWVSDLTHGKLAVACGRRKDQTGGVENAMADLIARGLIEKQRDGSDGRKWKYCISPNSWRDAPQYVTQVETAPAAEGAETADAKAETIERKSAGTFVVLPGRQSKVVTLGEAVQKVRFSSELPDAFGCDVATTEAGELHVRIYREEPETSHVESTTSEKNSPSDWGYEAVSPIPEIGEAKAKVEPAKQPVLPAPLPAPPPTIDPLKICLTQEAVQLVGKVVPAAILSQVRSDLNGAPVSYLADCIRAKAKAGKYTSHGILPHLARDAAERHRAERKLEAGAPPAAKSAHRKQRWENEGSWNADRLHWQELDSGMRNYYRLMFPDQVAKLENGGRS
jgi:hypothetical protein